MFDVLRFYVRFKTNIELFFKVWTTERNKLAFDRYLTWITITVKEDNFKPFKTPAILGGAFVATKRFLKEVDYFGLGMQGWGYENIELSMKV